MTGKELRTIRRRLGLSQTELAQRLEVHYMTVSRWENSTAVPKWVARELGKEN